jgi:hypothetical protein
MINNHHNHFSSYKSVFTVTLRLSFSLKVKKNAPANGRVQVSEKSAGMHEVFASARTAEKGLDCRYYSNAKVKRVFALK